MKPFFVAAGLDLRPLRRPLDHRHLARLHQGRRARLHRRARPGPDRHRHGARARARMSAWRTSRCRCRRSSSGRRCTTSASGSSRRAAIRGSRPALLTPLQAVAADRRRHHVARLRHLGDGAAARPRLRHHRRARQSSGRSRSCGWTQPPPGRRVMSARLCRELIGLMRSVISEEGTAPLAAIPGYTRLGQDRHGLEGRRRQLSRAPLSCRSSPAWRRPAPRVWRPRSSSMTRSNGLHQGGDVSAPVFAKVIGRALRLMAVAPDEPLGEPEQLRTASLQ